mmetsp:Transcript_64615/g.199988  ORF Transcript_64615/g.199988 Transcript_64615/m.199988 type:complete len:568 (+) Transcript_64615:44-1747(+)
MDLRCLRVAAAAASLGAVLCILAWCSAGTITEDLSAGRRLADLATRGSARGPGHWRRIGPGLPIHGKGSGDCTGCRKPVQSHDSRSMSLVDCQSWVTAGCPNALGQLQGCPDANALGYRVGSRSGEEHLCRAWLCEDAPGWTGDISWNCYLLTGNNSLSTSLRPPSTSRAPSGSRTSSTTPSTSSSATSLGSTSSSSTTSSTTSRRSTTPDPSPALPHCYEHPNITYSLDWRAQGRAFFDDWAFLLNDYNNGASEYLNHPDAVADRVVEAYETHAIIRTGPRGRRLKRKSVKIASHRTWKYGLMGMRFSHVPWGCGLWPAFWTHAPGFPWPEGGELDMLEYVNDIPSQTSFHTGMSNRCQLAGSVINPPFCPVMPDMNGMNYDCTTRYPLQLGCAVNKLPLMSPYQWAHFPSVILVEWTPRFMKVFVIPEREIPADIQADAPRPNTWDHWLVAYYPFARSNEIFPSTCPNPQDVMKPQQLVLQINFCGDWAGKVWPLSGSCVNRVGPHFPLQCRAVDPLLDRRPGALEEDCCTKFIYDADGTYGTEQYLAERAFFNISWVKVWNPVR